MLSVRYYKLNNFDLIKPIQRVYANEAYLICFVLIKHYIVVLNYFHYHLNFFYFFSRINLSPEMVIQDEADEAARRTDCRSAE